MTVEHVRVGEVLRLDRRPVQPDPTQEYTTIGIRSFGKGIFHYEPSLGSELGKLRFFEMEADCLVISNIKGWEGAIAVSTKSDQGCLASSRFLTYVPIDGRIDVQWARWFFLSEQGIELIQRASPGSADRNRTLAIERFENLQIPLPSIDEQRRVASLLGRVAAGAAAVKTYRAQSAVLGRALPLTVFLENHRRVATRPARLGDVLRFVREPIEIDPVAPYVSVGIRSFGRGVFHYPERPGSEIGKLRFQVIRPGLFAISNIKAWEGAVATTDDKDAGAVASSRFLLFEPLAGVDAIDYFWARLLVPEGLAALGHASPGSADRNRTLSVERFEDLVLEVASDEDQLEIGRLVLAARRAASEFDDLTTSSAKRLDALVPSALNQAFAHLT